MPGEKKNKSPVWIPVSLSALLATLVQKQGQQNQTERWAPDSFPKTARLAPDAGLVGLMKASSERI